MARLLLLRIENLALIRQAVLEPAAGLNALTGETGAGKTILAQAVELLTGAPARPALVGPHGEEAYVEAEFEVPDGFWASDLPAAVADLRPDGETTLVVARRVGRGGRSRALLWGRACARADLEAIGERLLEISSQHEARSLGRPADALALLDAYAGNGARLAAMRRAHAEAKAAAAAAEEARREAAEAGRRREEAELLLARVGAVADDAAAREELVRERERLRRVDELLAAAAGAADALAPEGDEPGAAALAGRAEAAIAAVARVDPALDAIAADLRDAVVRLQEAGSAARAYAADLEPDPGRLEDVDGRLAAIADVERRYGAPVEEVLARAEEARALLDRIDGAEGRTAALDEAAAVARARAEACADALADARADALPGLSGAVEAHLADLGMAGARFTVALAEAPVGPTGRDRVTPLLAANAGLPARPLAEVASGGELSRIALAVRLAALERRAEAEDDGAGAPLPTLLLDEIDAGVGGLTAHAVGEKLGRLAAVAQILCITHLAQIAGRADAHFRVEKTAGDPAATAVARLGPEEVVDELARMLGGAPEDDTVRRHALALRG